MADLKWLSETLIECSDKELENLMYLLNEHEGNERKLGITTNGDPIPPDPIKPPHHS